MPRPHQDAEQPDPGTEPAIKQRDHSNEPLEDEEKVLAGRTDANIPAMLTKDVPGG
jgi:hypothetical protein